MNTYRIYDLNGKHITDVKADMVQVNGIKSTTTLLVKKDDCTPPEIVAVINNEFFGVVKSQ
jgi:hypothetical protein